MGTQKDSRRRNTTTLASLQHVAYALLKEKQLRRLPMEETSTSESSWVKVPTSVDNEYYYMNTFTKVTTWDKPAGITHDIPIYGRAYTGEINEVDNDDDISNSTETTAHDDTVQTNDDRIQDKESSEEVSPWKEVQCSDGTVYYMNVETKETQWDRPDTPLKIVPYGKMYVVSEEVESVDDAESENNIVGQVIDIESGEESDSHESAHSLSPMKTKRRRVSCSVWSPRKVGFDSEETYYINNITGETSWQKPNELDDSIVDPAYEGIDFPPELDAEECYSLIGFNSNEHAAELEDMLVRGSTDNCYRRLQSFAKFLDEHKNEDLVSKLIEREDCVIVVAKHLGKRTSADVRMMVIQILLSKIAAFVDISNIVKTLLDAFGVQLIWLHTEQALKESISIETNEGTQDEFTQICLMRLISNVCILHNDAKSPEEMPRKSLINMLMSIMSDASKDCFIATCNALVYLNSLYNNRKYNVVMHVCVENAKSEYFGEALLHTINAQNSPHGDRGLLRGCLKVCCDLFSDVATSNFFYSNDLKVLVDIIIRGLCDLPIQDAIRTSFLEVLELLLTKSAWYSKGQYRCNDIVHTLVSIENSAAQNDDYNMEARERAKLIFFECEDVLEH